MSEPGATAVRRWAWLLPFGLGALVLAWGWAHTRFLCDDAFIAFRYVGNAYDGHGLVWNAAPWHPVEGYSCFLWVVSLWGVWNVFGVEPPVAANVLALLCAMATLAVVARGIGRAGGGGAAAAVVTCATAANPTFVTWSSSGLETAMFGWFAVAWTFAAVELYGRSEAVRRRWFALAGWAALAQLTRPDGALLCLATLPLVGHALLSRRLPLRLAVASLWPLVLPMLHFGWRRLYYGEWLPNTYYAKVVAAWPESGVRYLICFVLEHGVLPWLALALVWLAMAAVRGASVTALFGRALPAGVAVATWCAFVGYYSLIVGGDHFAWRPFAHLIPLLLAAAWWLLRELRIESPWRVPAIAVLGFFAAAPGWWLEGRLERAPTDGFVRTATQVPPLLRAPARVYDRCRAWLRLRFVALPRPLHAHNCEALLRLLPERRPGQVEGLQPGVRGLYRTVAAGVVAWGLPDVDILDEVGLNDWTVARSAVEPSPLPFEPTALAGAFAAVDLDADGRLSEFELARLVPLVNLDLTGVLLPPTTWAELLCALADADGDGLDQGEFADAVQELRDPRHMAHERRPPVGYLEAMRANVQLREGRFVLDASVPPMVEAEIVEVESQFRTKVKSK